MDISYNIESFNPPPDEELICSICRNVFKDPLECSCRHIFCKDCIENWLNLRKNCPICRKRSYNSDLRPVAPLIKNLISKLQMVCPNVGCQSKVPLGDYVGHMSRCDYENIDCGNNKCKRKCLRKDLDRHVDRECEYRLVSCTRDCNLKLFACDIGRHDCVQELKSVIRANGDTEVALRVQIDELNTEIAAFKVKMKDLEQKRSNDGDDSNEDSFTQDWFRNFTGQRRNEMRRNAFLNRLDGFFEGNTDDDDDSLSLTGFNLSEDDDVRRANNNAPTNDALVADQVQAVNVNETNSRSRLRDIMDQFFNLVRPNAENAQNGSRVEPIQEQEENNEPRSVPAGSTNNSRNIEEPVTIDSDDDLNSSSSTTEEIPTPAQRRILKRRLPSISSSSSSSTESIFQPTRPPRRPRLVSPPPPASPNSRVRRANRSPSVSSISSISSENSLLNLSDLNSSSDEDDLNLSNFLRCTRGSDSSSTTVASSPGHRRFSVLDVISSPSNSTDTSSISDISDDSYEVQVPERTWDLLERYQDRSNTSDEWTP